MAEDVRQHSNLIPRVLRGGPVKAKDWNQVGDHINRQNSGVTPALHLPNVADIAGLSTLGRFRIKFIEGDFLQCVTWNGVEEGTERINVARPVLLRKITASHNSVTFVYTDNVTRTASASGQDDETQVIVPAYVVDDEIIAIKGITRGTGAIASGNKQIVWQDLNIDARAWAKQAA